MHRLSLPLSPLDMTKSHLCHSVKLVLTEYLLILRKTSTFFRERYPLGSWWAGATAHYPWLFFASLSLCLYLPVIHNLSENPARQGPSLFTVFIQRVAHWLCGPLLETWTATLTL